MFSVPNSCLTHPSCSVAGKLVGQVALGGALQGVAHSSPGLILCYLHLACSVMITIAKEEGRNSEMIQPGRDICHFRPQILLAPLSCLILRAKYNFSECLGRGRKTKEIAEHYYCLNKAYYYSSSTAKQISISQQECREWGTGVLLILV